MYAFLSEVLTLCVEEPTALGSIKPGLKQVLTGAEGLRTVLEQAESLVTCLTGMAGLCYMGEKKRAIEQDNLLPS